MDSFVERIFLAELVAQAEAGSRALRAADEALKGLSTPPNPSSGRHGTHELVDAFHDHVADFLNHAAVVSKLLSPPGEKKNPERRLRAEHLRMVLQVDLDEPILARTLRDQLEHIDERLDQWAKSRQLGGRMSHFIDKNIGGENGIVIDGKSAIDVALRNYNPEKIEYSVFGDKHNLRILASSMHRICNCAKFRLGNPNSQ